jgi:hypothetical protein
MRLSSTGRNELFFLSNKCQKALSKLQEKIHKGKLRKILKKREISKLKNSSIIYMRKQKNIHPLQARSKM